MRNILFYGVRSSGKGSAGRCMQINGKEIPANRSALDYYNARVRGTLGAFFLRA